MASTTSQQERKLTMLWLAAYVVGVPVTWFLLTWMEIRDKVRWSPTYDGVPPGVIFWWAIWWPFLPVLYVLGMVFVFLGDVAEECSKLRDDFIDKWIEHEKKRQGRKRAETRDV